MADLVTTPNGTYVTREIAEIHGLEVSKPASKPASKSKPARKPATRTAARKPATTRKGK